jgi:Ca2+-binding EF-hand superfamily protein
MHANINQLKQKINHEGINVKDYFRFIDLQDKGYISARCFQDVLTENNIFCDDKDLKCLMKLFKKKVDERICMQEFSQFLDL